MERKARNSSTQNPKSTIEERLISQGRHYLARLIRSLPLSDDLWKHAISVLTIQERNLLQGEIAESIKIIEPEKDLSKPMDGEKLASCISQLQILPTRGPSIEGDNPITLSITAIEGESKNADRILCKDVSNLQVALGISNSELDILKVYLVAEAVPAIKKIMESGTPANPFRVLSISTGLGVRQIAPLLDQNRPLRRDGLIIKGKADVGFHEMGMKVNKVLLDYLASGEHSCIGLSKKKSIPTPRPLSSFVIKPQELEIVISLIELKSGFSSIVTGNTADECLDFVLSVASSIRHPVHTVDPEEFCEVDTLFLMLRMAMIRAVNDNGILVIEKPGPFLFSPWQAEDACLLNRFISFIGNCPAPIIWTIPSNSQVKRKLATCFTFKLPLGEPTLQEQVILWNHHLQESKVGVELNPDLISSLACDYPSSSYSIRNALQSFATLQQKIKEENPKTILSTLIRRSPESIEKTNENLTTIDSKYDERVLNLDVEPSLIIDAVQRALLGSTDWKESVCLLFWGPPGTGKTAFASWIAQTIGKQLIIRPASSILDKWVGSSERNLVAAFTEAEEKNAILLLDEIDGLLFSRGAALQMHERNITNELLQSMEKTKVILICCTNSLSSLDPAAIRRFSFKIEFRTLTPEKGKLLFLRYFENREIPSSILERFDGMTGLAPGHFKAVRSRLVLAGRMEPLEFVEELSRELKYSATCARKAGFTV